MLNVSISTTNGPSRAASLNDGFPWPRYTLYTAFWATHTDPELSGHRDQRCQQQKSILP
ncbi:unnamed protein product [Dovyalis caffra]|uniref:Uncharacterized protein n=1 Tax=Dovyalis caffra TaxID=77055 RepID=A0AAV1R9G1_9ROSI|nr:unnamed protein product [Dovyalis caffra]